MPSLQDFRDGKADLNAMTTITYNGQIYRGKKAILELADRVLPVRDEPEKVIENEQATDSEPAASEPKPKQRRKRRAKKDDTTTDN